MEGTLFAAEGRAEHGRDDAGAAAREGMAACDDDGHAFRYRAAVPREATLGEVVRRLVDTAFGGSAEGLVMALLHDRGVSKEEARRIKKMIDRAEDKTS